MRLLIGLGMSLIVAIGAYVSFASRPPPVFAETRITAEHFAVTGMTMAGERLVAVGELGHILLSDDQGKTWGEAQVKDSRGSALTQVVFFNDKEGVAVGHDAWALFTEDGGLNWRETLFDKDFSEPLLGVWGLAEGPVFAYGSFGRFFVSNDHGRTWEKREPGIGDAHIYAMNGAADGHLMMVGEHGLAFKSTDFGQTWQAIPEFYRGTMFGLIRLSAEEWIAYGLRGNIFRTTDFGATWTQIPTHLSIGLFGHAVLPDGRIMIVGQGGVMLESRDNGANFNVIQENKGNNLTAIVALPDGRLLTAGLGGIHNFDGGQQGEQK
ncbi:conserved exported protein of unknown function [Sterolibacterium denitrificans]|uniref:Photosynthesis system II assembly factor Ycf48/Hcf136-like domain-containing protein n=1 Tax=Sterolibacterium denitrificans TaxID=157592 RepID=A0A7Z7HT66_9PROT|nr:YCF48-related protein [Sterolibacterium denitrificans]SMB32108.1 conserved exported protein of unknown function [Sterolibacterium denitrificans]